AQGRGGDHTEDSFAADEDWREIWTVGAPVEGDDLATTDDTLEREDHVLDLPVETRALAGAARGDPTSDRRAQDAGGEVPQREAAPLQAPLEADAGRAGLAVDGGRALIDRPPSLHPLQIEQARVAGRQRPAADA